jgi:hypothetical protein
MVEKRPDASPQLLTVSEFRAESRLSVATIHRLKNQGKIPFYQPAGKRGRVLFPADAIERAASAAAKPSAPVLSAPLTRSHLSGPPPAWMQPFSP